MKKTRIVILAIVIVAAICTAFYIVNNNSKKESAKEAIKKLNNREKLVLDLRFYKGRTQIEVADEIGISQAQVSRIEKNALKNMRKYI